MSKCNYERLIIPKIHLKKKGDKQINL